MRISLFIAFFLLPCVLWGFIVETVFAEESYMVIASPDKPDFIRFTNENWFDLADQRVASFSVKDNGDSYGYTETGVYFTQKNIADIGSHKVQLFEIQDHYHYIIDGVPVYSLEEFSILLANAT
jgi:hypothetical protein